MKTVHEKHRKFPFQNTTFNISTTSAIWKRSFNVQYNVIAIAINRWHIKFESKHMQRTFFRVFTHTRPHRESGTQLCINRELKQKINGWATNANYTFIKETILARTLWSVHNHISNYAFVQEILARVLALSAELNINPFTNINSFQIFIRKKLNCKEKAFIYMLWFDWTFESVLTNIYAQ